MNRKLWAAPLAAVLIIVTGAANAWADDPDFYEDGNRRGVTLRDSKIVVTPGGGGGSVQVDVPDCWYEPKVAPEDMSAWVRDNFQSDRRAGEQPPGQAEIDEHQDDDGMYWMPSFMDTAAGVSCAEDLAYWIFVPAGETPPNGITPRMLADIARAFLTVEPPTIEVNPDARSYVELGTWVWATDVPPQYEVTATLPGPGGMSATVRATPGDLTIEPGTPNATVHACEGFGKPYPANASARVAKSAPPCGVTYHRSSPGGSFPMEVSLHWDVVWVQGGVDMTDVDVSTTVDVVVDEIQTRNGGG